MLRSLIPDVPSPSSGRTTLLQCTVSVDVDHHGPHFTQVDRLTAQLTLVTCLGLLAAGQHFYFLLYKISSIGANDFVKVKDLYHISNALLSFSCSI